jgi:hypothetical protein
MRHVIIAKSAISKSFGAKWPCTTSKAPTETIIIVRSFSLFSGQPPAIREALPAHDRRVSAV